MKNKGFSLLFFAHWGFLRNSSYTWVFTQDFGYIVACWVRLEDKLYSARVLHPPQISRYSKISTSAFRLLLSRSLRWNSLFWSCSHAVRNLVSLALPLVAFVEATASVVAVFCYCHVLWPMVHCCSSFPSNQSQKSTGFFCLTMRA